MFSDRLDDEDLEFARHSFKCRLCFHFFAGTWRRCWEKCRFSTRMTERFFPVRKINEEKHLNGQKTSSDAGETDAGVKYCY